jgi:molecular chaperone HtpG
MTMTESNQAAAEAQTQELPFQAEVQQILHLMVHSLYTHPEVFLRELIANASDALDKARFVALTDPGVAERIGEREIRISTDQDAHTLSIEDSGIGMTRSEIVDNLGTIARSGTLEFLKTVKAKGTTDPGAFIGQFGVGFYSSFIVADRVDVESRSATSADAEPVLWRSSGSGSFTVTHGERDRVGTRVTVHLKPEYHSLIEPWRLESLIKKYSEFVSHPIHLGDKTINPTSAIWLRPKAEITDDQYGEFYKHVMGGLSDAAPLSRIHVSSDAPIQYHALLFIPDKAPFDLMLDVSKRGLRLYAKRMLVMDSCDKLLPSYLRFMRGVVDSEDLALNISREMLQDDRTLEAIQKQITKQTIKILQEMASGDADRYRTFWKEFGRLFRLGISADPANREAIAALLRYPSTRSTGDELIALSTYVDRMRPGQKAIYYLTGPDLKALQSSPHLEVFRRKGIEVLLMADPVDEFVVGALPKFQDKALESIAHGTIDVSSVEAEGGTEPQQPEHTDEERSRLQKCIDMLKKVLADQVKDVRASKRMTESASCLVADDGDLSPNLERVMRMLDREVQTPKRVLEINADHELVKNLGVLVEREGDSDQVRTFCGLLLDQALLADGVVPEPAALLKRIQQVMNLACVRERKPD